MSNGATLLYTPNTVNDIIAISIDAKGGQLIEKKAGTSKLTASAMMKGTKNYSSLELSQVLEDNGIKFPRQPELTHFQFLFSQLKMNMTRL